MTLSYISLLPSWFPLQKRPQIAYSILTQIFCRIRCNCTLSFVGPSVSPSIGLSIGHTLIFLCFCGLYPYCSCPNALVHTNTAPAHPHMIGVTVHPALILMEIALSKHLGPITTLIVPNQVVPVGTGFVHKDVPIFMVI